MVDKRLKVYSVLDYLEQRNSDFSFFPVLSSRAYHTAGLLGLYHKSYQDFLVREATPTLDPAVCN